MDESEKLFEAMVETDSWLVSNQKKADSLKAKLDPRTRFNLWRNSQAGKQWREEKYLEQLGCCALCGEKMEPPYIHIDHIEPISKRPDLAVATRNLQLTHPPCNLEKATS